MFPGRMVSPCHILLFAIASAACGSDSSTGPMQDGQLVEVDLSQFPGAGGPVPNQTVLSDQWTSVGILFGAEPAGVDLVKEDFGGDEAHIFFSPDVHNAIAVFRFVEPGSTNAVDVTAFDLIPWFNPGESAELVGFDESGTQVVVDSVTAADIGGESLSLQMSIEGTFRVAEWRTHGNPGIAARSLTFRR